MSRCPARHAKTTSRYEGRHAKPGTPVSTALIGTAAKAVPASLAVSAAGSALVLAGPASAAVVPPAGLVHSGAADLGPVKTAAESTWVTTGRHAAPRSVYTVVAGDTLSGISARFCGTAADYKTLAAASGITDANIIHAGQPIKLACHTHAPAQATLLAFHKHVRHHHAAPSSGAAAQAPAPQPQAPQPQAPTASTAGMSAFESCVISRESGGDPTAYNPSSGAGGLFGFLPSTWASLGYGASYPGGAQTAPSSVQEAAFAKLYAEAGTAPWAPYDGC